jgi:chemotaxis signal transduction protein
MLLDLSMPEMGGMEVLRIVKADSTLAHTPIIIVSSEEHRRQECLGAGADEFLAKPVRAPDLLAAVNRVIEASRGRAMQGGLAILFLQIGDVELGVPLDGVALVVCESATIPLPGGPAHLHELIDLHGTPVLVLDTAVRLGTSYDRAAADRVFVVLVHEGRRFCLRADGVRDPQMIPPDRLDRPPGIGGSDTPDLRKVLQAIARTDRGPIPVLDPRALVSGEMLDRFSAPVDRQSS